MFYLLQVKYGAKRESFPGQRGESNEFDLGVARSAANRAVGGTEVDADGRSLNMRLLHSLYYSACGAMMGWSWIEVWLTYEHRGDAKAVAGQGNYKQLVETSASEYDELMNANMRSGFAFSRVVAPHFIAQRSGCLLFVSSIAGLQGIANESAYCATKFAQIGFAQALDAELRGFGVRVGVFCPGGIKTEFAIGRGRTTQSVADSFMMEASEVADAIVFACMQSAHTRVLQMTIRSLGAPQP